MTRDSSPICSLRTLVSQKFVHAKATRNIIFSDTQLEVLTTRHGIPFQLRYCPALAKKPKGDKEQSPSEKPKPRFDPFEHPPADLMICQIPENKPSHILVLNKYPVIANHFILATKDNKPQTDLLEEIDLALTHECLKAWEQDQDDGKKSRSLFAFFNSGEFSGASQAHRHVQFLPTEDMVGPNAERWPLLMRRMARSTDGTTDLLQDPELPFIHFAATLVASDTPQSVHAKYIDLLKASWAAMTGQVSSREVKMENIARDQACTFSYNLAMTTDKMAIMPRREEASPILGLKNSSIAINGTILGGTLMVKMLAEWEELRKNPDLLEHMLVRIGFPLDTSEQ